MSRERIARLQLIRTGNIGPATYHALMEQFGNAEQAISALPELVARGHRKKHYDTPNSSNIEQEIANIQAIGGRVLFHDDEEFPNLLRHIDPAPPVIMVLGDVSILGKPSLAIVGARNGSANGLRIAGNLAAQLGSNGYTIVSGMARGIDGAAHKGALSTGTCAVLAGGVDNIYPPDNKDLYAEIQASGCIISEMPLGYQGRAKDFPRRNRLISGLSLGTIVVEAALRSGSLITARFALEHSREVFAVPGSPLDPRTRGANSLIKQGAHLVENVEDVLNVLEQFPNKIKVSSESVLTPNLNGPSTVDLLIDKENLSVWRDKVINLLSPSPIEVDDLIRLSGAPPGAVHSLLLEIDIAGQLDRQPGQRVALR